MSFKLSRYVINQKKRNEEGTGKFNFVNECDAGKPNNFRKTKGERPMKNARAYRNKMSKRYEMFFSNSLMTMKGGAAPTEEAVSFLKVKR